MLYMAWSIRQFMSIFRKRLGLFPLQRTWTVSYWVILPAYYQYQGFKTAEAFGLGQRCTNFPKNTDPIWMLFPQRLADASWEWRNQWTFNKGVCIIKTWKFIWVFPPNHWNKSHNFSTPSMGPPWSNVIPQRFRRKSCPALLGCLGSLFLHKIGWHFHSVHGS